MDETGHLTQTKCLLSAKLKNDVHEALKLWYRTKADTSPLDYLYLFQQAQREGSGNPRQATHQIILQALKVLAVDYGEEAELLRLRFLDGQKMPQVAMRLNLSEPTAYKKQRQAIDHLADTLQTLETQARDHYQAALEKQLQLGPDVELIGIADSLKQLLNLLSSAEPPWLISIEGLGGIGKTSLASAVVRQPELSGPFHNIAWVSAKQEEFFLGIGLAETNRPALDTDTLTDALLEQLGRAHALAQSPQEKRFALARLLKQAPYLIVIDNLETVTDYQTLLPTLRELANPSKFLLTSRHSLRAHPDVFCLNLEELNQADTIRLIRYEAKVRGLSMLLNADDAHLQRIYEAVGGNPLALKLVIGQISVLSLSQVLENLKQAQGKEIDALYTYIYWQAWHALDPASQQALLVMPLAQNGTLVQLAALCQLEPHELSQALQQLVTLSLVQVSGGLEDRRYTIHRLTESFLLKEAIQWQSSL
jgi:hypothetical protein